MWKEACDSWATCLCKSWNQSSWLLLQALTLQYIFCPAISTASCADLLQTLKTQSLVYWLKKPIFHNPLKYIKFPRHDFKAGKDVAEKCWKMETQNLRDPAYLLRARHWAGSCRGAQATGTSSPLYETHTQWPALTTFWMGITCKSKQIISWQQDKS